jgi:hypothetical protein
LEGADAQSHGISLALYIDYFFFVFAYGPEAEALAGLPKADIGFRFFIYR